MTERRVTVHVVESDKQLNVKALAREIAQQIRKGNLHNDKRTEIRRGA